MKESTELLSNYLKQMRFKMQTDESYLLRRINAAKDIDVRKIKDKDDRGLSPASKDALRLQELFKDHIVLRDALVELEKLLTYLGNENL